MWVSVIRSKMPKVRLKDQARASIFTGRKFISLNILVHILFAVKGVFSKDFEPMVGIYAMLVKYRRF